MEEKDKMKTRRNEGRKNGEPIKNNVSTSIFEYGRLPVSMRATKSPSSDTWQ